MDSIPCDVEFLLGFHNNHSAFFRKHINSGIGVKFKNTLDEEIVIDGFAAENIPPKATVDRELPSSTAPLSFFLKSSSGNLQQSEKLQIEFKQDNDGEKDLCFVIDKEGTGADEHVIARVAKAVKTEDELCVKLSNVTATDFQICVEPQGYIITIRGKKPAQDKNSIKLMLSPNTELSFHVPVDRSTRGFPQPGGTGQAEIIIVP